MSSDDLVEHLMEHNKAQEILREKLLKEAKDSVQSFEKSEDVLAAILTGSAAWGKPNPDGDLDILLITEGRTGVLYRYLIPGFCGVKRRTEFGYIPYDIAARQVKKGYGSTISCNLIEQLKNGRILFQRDAKGDDLVKSSRDVFPNTFTIGKLINDIREALREIGENLDSNQLKEAILAMRRAVQISARVLLLGREKVGVAKEKHEYRAVRAYLKKLEAQEYRELMGIKGISGRDSRQTLGKSIALIRWVLQGCSISPHLVEYGRRSEPKGNST
jgi:hypothetical protein